jgi:acetyltransferase-like isoleucine patch superfamily enzyme
MGSIGATLRLLAALLAVVLPGKAKRSLYRLLGHQVHDTAKIGLSLLVADRITLGPGSSIGHFNLILVDELIIDEGAWVQHLNVFRHCDLVHLEEYAQVGALNIANGIGRTSEHLPGVERHPALILGAHGTITYGHFLDTSDTIRLGAFSGLAGWQCQILSHAFDPERSALYTAPVEIGDYAVAATASVLLPGARLPDYSFLGANSVLNKRFEATHKLYAGNPAVEVRDIDPALGLFERTVGELP